MSQEPADIRAIFLRDTQQSVINLRAAVAALVGYTEGLEDERLKSYYINNLVKASDAILEQFQFDSKLKSYTREELVEVVASTIASYAKCTSAGVHDIKRAEQILAALEAIGAVKIKGVV